MDADFLGILLLGAELLWVAIDIAVFALCLRVWNIVRHTSLILIGISCVLAALGTGLMHVTEIPYFPMEHFSTVSYVLAGLWIINGLTFFFGMWQLLNWIPQLLDLKVLDQRDEPFRPE